LNWFKNPEEMIRRLRRPEDMIGRAKEDIGSFKVPHPQVSLSHSSTSMIPALGNTCTQLKYEANHRA